MKILSDNGTYRAHKCATNDRLRIAALCCDDPQQNYLISQLASRFNLVGAVIEPGRDQLRRLFATGNYIDWLYRYWHILRQKITGRSRYRREYFLPLTNGTRPASERQVEWIGSDATIRTLSRLSPDLTIVCGTMYVPKRVIDAAGFIINIHGGFLPHYRGNHCIFFAYYKNDYSKIAATLHILTKELDGGDIIEVIKPTIYPHDNDEHLYCRSLHKAMLRLFAIIDAFEKGEMILVCKPQSDASATMYRHRNRKPWHDALVWIRRLVRMQRVPHIPHTGDLAHL